MKPACALQTVFSVLICACVMTVEIAKRFYTKKKEKLNSTQVTKMMKKNELLFKLVFYYILYTCSNDVEVCITFIY